MPTSFRVHTRRSVIAGVAASAMLGPAWARPQSEPAAGRFKIDWQGGPETPAVAASLAAQIALVRSLRIKPEIAAFFAAQPIAVDLADDTHTRAGPRGVFFERRAVPPDNPVLLHELLHRYQLLRLPEGHANPAVIGFYDSVKASGRFPAQAYMFKNPFEFFAMTASVALYGRAARPPSTRANLREKAPELYQWIVTQFGLLV